MGLGLSLTDEDGNVISSSCTPNSPLATKKTWLKFLTSISPQFLQTRIWTIFQNRDVCAGTRIY